MKTPSLKINILSSYISQVYIIFISIFILPFYIKYMGAEAYGLVGFFAMLQGVFALLDFGLRPTISRQTAQYNGGSLSKLDFRRLFRALNIIFIFIAVLGGLILLILSKKIVSDWLKIENLTPSDVLFAVQIMAISVCLRWMTGLFRGVISGFEKIVWLSVVNSLIATLRFPLVLVYMYYFGFTVRSFFVYQLFVALLEFSLYSLKSYRLLPRLNTNENIGWSLKPIRPIIGFALSVAFTSSVWIIITQLDKFVLSGILTLSEYGYFSLAVLVSAGVLQISAPISGSIMPRMAKLQAEKKFEEIRKIYLNSTQFVSVVVVTAGIVLAGVAEPFLFAWTNDIDLAKNAAPILTLYALGNALLALSAFPYYLQYTKGNLKYHLIGNIILVLTLIPMIIWAAINYGGVGAGWVWLITQAIYLVFWVSYVHIKIEPRINIEWFKSFLPSLISVYIFIALFSSWLTLEESRLIIILKISILSLLSIVISIFSSRNVFRGVRKKLIYKKDLLSKLK
ncbi:oligosaccharide flippase family protein [Psychrobacter proteolyticus]|uniref:oligosaccharide flippase family protein n=2 Tax=Psychrobacter proteolyticus TaxID=147825 RepID=UPI000E0A7C9E|nr:oligosaccharide flippase family protein [Psychrobacter proteolyticus]